MSRDPIAVSVMPLETRRDVLIAVARMADRLGYDAFFMPETWANDITVLLAGNSSRRRRPHQRTSSPAMIASVTRGLARLLQRVRRPRVRVVANEAASRRH
jgi:alkanesulfonate monooxygenase SsuD/methylene tetrahydromethanopterin reductase-like flavin-dependent oxidoreductase (luciferase family)